MAAKKPAPASAPAYYVALVPLFIDGNPFARAFNPGDHVPVGHVETYGWHDLVRLPDPPPTTPDAAPGQAITSKEGD